MLPERLKELRKNANLTQKKIAEDLNISQQAYQIWESGKRKAGQETLQMFSNYFNVSIDYLLGNTDIKDYDNTDFLFRSSIKDLNLTDEEKQNFKKELDEFIEQRRKALKNR
ncbi:helix-turn-helix domain-containing protein [Streptococcus parauberis]|uniref:helix-turn-helix domain-containing protein n=1 Tax=Streptococcus parauberis TaxID=1348 RepID=UPI0037B59CCE